MHEIKNLYGVVKEKAYDYGILKPEIPSYVTDNLKYDFFEWQKKAFENFLTYKFIKERETPKEPTHLMFNMATGTGKTLLMAAAIIYYYKQGYRHFIFFVNQNNIIDKTENNFIDDTHTKFLFKEKIIIDDKTIPIKKVETFSEYSDGIEIKFTTIQKLYNDIHIERENRTTLEDLHKLNIVMLADEAHHLNAETKSKNGVQEELLPTALTNRTNEKEIERKGWEHTVIELILKRNSSNKENNNVLLEFTATIPANENVERKYSDKIIYKFGLKEFLSAGYTKEINLITSTLGKKERVLQALLFHWYRHKIALKNGIPNFKPVILFRSKTIIESKEDYKEFLDWTSNLSAKDFNFLKEIGKKVFDSKNLYEQGKSRTEQVLNFIEKKNISFWEIAEFIKNNFNEKTTIITNSKTNKTKSEKTTEEQEKLLNSLEDKNNHIRAIFTVDRLTEGWDVLNLFDIVRLYQGQNAGGSTNVAPPATVKEKQLIGRGVRYFPFNYENKIRNKRKFDEDLKNELRILEELFYYTFDEESRYISHLKNELRRDGYIRDEKIVKTFRLKNEFFDTPFYIETKIWYNKQKENPHRKKKSLTDLQKDLLIKYKIKGLEISEQKIDFENSNDLHRLDIIQKGLHTIKIKVKEIEKHIFRKAINIKSNQDNSLFQFEKLKEELEITTIDDLQKSNFFGNFNIEIIAGKDTDKNNLSNYDMLNLSLKFLNSLLVKLRELSNPKIGSEFLPDKFSKFFGEPKTKSVKMDEDSDRISESLKNEKWYVLDSFYGTSEEKGLIEFIKETIGNLQEKYNEVYLLRNEEIYKIYDFEKGRGFQPDYLLFLKDKKELFYQIFIEPKGNDYYNLETESFLDGKEGWKEKFLEQISEKYGFGDILKAENKDYRLIGLPFFNKDHNSNFREKYQKVLE